MTLFENLVDAVHILFSGSRDRSCRVELPERNEKKNGLKGLFHDWDIINLFRMIVLGQNNHFCLIFEFLTCSSDEKPAEFPVATL
jgi:hypothetical protein